MKAKPDSRLPRGAVPSPNIWEQPATYEVENRAFDPDGLVYDAMAARAPWTGREVLDLGCGTGFHLPFFAATAARVVGVEPHPDLVGLARRRTRSLAHVSVVPGTAQHVPLPDASVDLVHVRWAYFFGPGCEPGLRELDRVVRRGGTAFVIDNDASRSTFGRWFRLGYPKIDPGDVERFWARQGWTRTPVLTRFSFGTHADLEAVVRIEFDPDTAEKILAEHRESGGGTDVDYAVNVWSRDW
jgi:ubiquinone/menaquinone biosynthesis C-methylase UbiE